MASSLAIHRPSQAFECLDHFAPPQDGQVTGRPSDRDLDLLRFKGYRQTAARSNLQARLDCLLHVA